MNLPRNRSRLALREFSHLGGVSKQDFCDQSIQQQTPPDPQPMLLVLRSQHHSEEFSFSHRNFSQRGIDCWKRRCRGEVFPSLGDIGEQTAPTPELEASISTINRRDGTGMRRTGTVVNSSLRILVCVRGPGEVCSRGSEASERSCNSAVVPNKPMVKMGKTQKPL